MAIALQRDRDFPSIAYMRRLSKRYKSVFGHSAYGVDRKALVSYAWQLAYRYSRMFPVTGA